MIIRKTIKYIINFLKENLYFHYLIIKYINKFKNVYVVSAAGYNDIGDDLILLYTKKLFPNKHIRFLIDGINHNKKIIENISNLNVEIAYSLPQNSKRKSLILIGGGTLFNSEAFNAEPYLDYAYKLIKNGYNVGFWGIEIINLNNKSIAKEVFKKSIFIGVRNEETQKIISTIDQKLISKAIVIGDIIEHYPKRYLKQKQHKIIGICISPKSKIKKTVLLELVKKYQNQNYQVEFFSFCNHPFSVDETDSSYFTWLQTNNSQISTFNTSNLNCLFNRIKTYQLIITSRLHVTIIASKLSIKTINISKEKKNINFCKSHNIKNTNINSLLRS